MTEVGAASPPAVKEPKAADALSVEEPHVLKAATPPVVEAVVKPAAAGMTTAVVPPKPATKTAVKPAAGVVVVPAASSRPIKPASALEAGASDSGAWKRKRTEAGLEVAGLPSFFPKASELGPDVSEDITTAIKGAEEQMKYFCSTVRKVGLAAEPGFNVSFFSILLLR